MRLKDIHEIMGSGRRSIATRSSGVTLPDQDKCHGRQWALGGSYGCLGFLRDCVCQFCTASFMYVSQRTLGVILPALSTLLFETGSLPDLGLINSAGWPIQVLESLLSLPP